MPRSAIATYRNVPHIAEEFLLTVQEVSELLEVSVRTVKRQIARGRFAVVRFSARRMRVDAEHSVWFWHYDHGPALEPLFTIADLIRQRNAHRQSVARALKAQRQRRRRLIRAVVRVMVARVERTELLMTVRFIATMCERSRRSVYHDIAKGALREWSTDGDFKSGKDVLPIVTIRQFGSELLSTRLNPSRRRQVLICWTDALAYAPAAARQQILSRVAIEYYADAREALGRVDRDAAVDHWREIIEEFSAWLTEHSAGFASAKR